MIDRTSALATALLVGLPLAASAQEVEPEAVHLSDLHGFLRQRSTYTEETTGSAADPALAYQRRPFLEQELFLLAKGFVYHPNLLRFELGGGPVLAETRASYGGGTSSDQALLWNLRARAAFLEKKPYPVTLSVERSNPWVEVGIVERFPETDTRAAADFSFRPPGAPLELTAQASHLQSEGRGTRRIVDERVDYAFGRVTLSPAFEQQDRLLVSAGRRDSRSGDPTLLIHPTLTDSRDAQVDSHHRLWRGATLDGVMSWNEQWGAPDHRLARAAPRVRWELRDDLVSSIRYTRQESLTSGRAFSQQEAGVSLDHHLYESLYSSLDAHAGADTTPGLSNEVRGVKGSVRYAKKIPGGTVAIHYSLLSDWHDRDATVADIPVAGEQVVLAGTTPAPLASPFIDIATIVVRNLTRTQIYVLGTDYDVLVIGASTRIVRLITGAILSGETVLVDYAFRTGGSVRYSMLDQGYGIELSLFQHLHLFARRQDAQPTQLSGASAVPLNRIHGTTVGASAEIPWGRFSTGGGVTYEVRDETLTPYTATGADAFVQVAPGLGAVVKAGLRRSRVSYWRSSNDVDLSGGSARVEWSRGQARLSADTIFEEDVGGTLPRTRLEGAATAEYRVRQLVFRAEGRLLREAQGAFRREAARFFFEARREF